MTSLDDRLMAFAKSARMLNKGALCVALVVTRHAKTLGLPLVADKLLTEGGGQVLGLGKGKVQSILKSYGIDRVLAEEGGRTSRGSVGNMKAYVQFLNKLADASSQLDEIEKWWVVRVEGFFKAKPFKLRFDAASSMRSVVRDLLRQAEQRQQGGGGMMFQGTMLQHLVGAKLEVLLGRELESHGVSVADVSTERDGDYLIEDVVIHVTCSPSEALMRKCQANVEHGRRPLIITPYRRVAVAETMAETAGIADRVDIFDAEQFLAGNFFELAKFSANSRRTAAVEIIEKYNEIVSKCETDPSLQISVQ
jgi:hypothetical protein